MFRISFLVLCVFFLVATPPSFAGENNVVPLPKLTKKLEAATTQTDFDKVGLNFVPYLDYKHPQKEKAFSIIREEFLKKNEQDQAKFLKAFYFNNPDRKDFYSQLTPLTRKNTTYTIGRTLPKKETVAALFQVCLIADGSGLKTLSRDCFLQGADTMYLGQQVLSGFKDLWRELPEPQRAYIAKDLIGVLSVKYAGYYPSNFADFIRRERQSSEYASLYTLWETQSSWQLSVVNALQHAHVDEENVILHNGEKVPFKIAFQLLGPVRHNLDKYVSFQKNLAQQRLDFADYKKGYEILREYVGAEAASSVIHDALLPTYSRFVVSDDPEPNIHWHAKQAEQLIKKFKSILTERDYQDLSAQFYSKVAHQIAVISKPKAIEYLEAAKTESPKIEKRIEELKKPPYTEVTEKYLTVRNQFEYDPKYVHKVMSAGPDTREQLKASLEKPKLDEKDIELAADWLDLEPQLAEKILLRAPDSAHAKALLRYMRDKKLLSHEAINQVDDEKFRFRPFFGRGGSPAEFPLNCAMWRLDASNLIDGFLAAFGNDSIYPPHSCAMDRVDATSIPAVGILIDFRRYYQNTTPGRSGCTSYGTAYRYVYAAYNSTDSEMNAKNPYAFIDLTILDKSVESLVRDKLTSPPHWAFYGIWNKLEYEKLYPLSINALNALALYYEKGFGISADKAKTAAYHVLFDDWSPGRYQTTPADFDAQNMRKALLQNQPVGASSSSVTRPIPNEMVRKVDTPLQIAAAYRPELVAEFIGAGAKVDRANWFGKTPLMYAVQYSQMESVKQLLNRGANVNAQTIPFEDITAYGCGMSLSAALRTPLMYAAWHSNPEVVQYLLKHGADKTMEDSNGLRAYDYLDANKNLAEADLKKLKELLN